MSEGKSWRTPAAVIGIATVLLTAAGIYISKQGSDHEREKGKHQQELDEAARRRQEVKDNEVKNRIADLTTQLNQEEARVREFEAKINTTYRHIQDYDFKRKDPLANDASRDADNESYLIAQQNLQIFSKSKSEHERRRDELRKEINDLTKQ